MTSLELHSSLDNGQRPQTHQGIASSPSASPRIPRPSSQASVHLGPGGSYSPASSFVDHPAYPHPQPYRPYQPSALALPSPLSQPNYMNNYPTTTPSIPFYPSTAPIYDSRGSHPMIRTISHAHPMGSATDHTVSSRYSSSPTVPNDAPPTASIYPMHSMHAPSFAFQEAESRHINPALFNQNGYPMSRSTSGASDAAPELGTRLLTPHYEYRNDNLSPGEQELRKVSDSLGRVSNNRFYPQAFSPSYDVQNQGLGLGAHPQPDGLYFGRGYANDHFAVSAERGDSKPDISTFHGDTEYERERAAQIMSNKKLLDDVGLGAAGNSVRRNSLAISS